jgi:hypothetical protein
MGGTSLSLGKSSVVLFVSLLGSTLRGGSGAGGTLRSGAVAFSSCGSFSLGSPWIDYGVAVFFFDAGLLHVYHVNTVLPPIDSHESMLFPLYHASLKVIGLTHIVVHACTIGKEQ